MIKGLNVRLYGHEVKALAEKRLVDLVARIVHLQEQKKVFGEAFDASGGTSSNDVRPGIQDKINKPQVEYDELRFISEHLADDLYELDRRDLYNLGIVASAY